MSGTGSSYSTFAPDALAILAHVAMSATTKLANCSGVLPTGTATSPQSNRAILLEDGDACEVWYYTRYANYEPHASTAAPMQRKLRKRRILWICP